jgi:hypothetical protein
MASIAAMGCFALVYGKVTKSAAESADGVSNASAGTGNDNSSGANGSLQRKIMVFSSSLSVIVGVVWLVLLHYGKLEEVFG